MTAKASKSPRVLTLDVENSPHLAYTYDLWGADIRPDQIMEPARLLCWAAKWLDRKQVLFASEYHDGVDAMLNGIWELLNEADIVVTYNGVRHDMPIILKSLVERGYPPVSPWQDIDLYQVVKRRYKFASNSLGYITKTLDMPTKLATGVPQLWKRVLEEDEKAWTKFRAYNKQDVVVTENLFKVLQPWIKGPHAGLWSGDLGSCPSCGSDKLEPAGLTYTKTAKYARLLCECGAYCKVLNNGQTRPV